ncbi:hypothetical protein G9A89_006253 [Geosiphon pyriformis]|nr:hypothetical protein G9A89_006253 [Geosiphon pyriformis]
MGFFLSTALLNNHVTDGSLSSNGKMVSKDSFSVIVAGGMLLWSFGVVFGLIVETDRLLEAVADKLLVAVMDKLLVAVVDKLVVNILVVNRLVAASLASKWFDIVLNLIDNSELRTGNQSFNIDFLIIGYLHTSGSQFGYVLVYHNSDRYTFPVATVDWSMKMNVVGSVND